MLVLISVFHIVLALAIIGLVLLQDSKGGAMGIFGGGSSNSVFGSSGGANFLETSTKYVAIAFCVTCVALAYITTSKSGSVTDKLMAPVKQSTPLNNTNAAATTEKETPVQESSADEKSKAPESKPTQEPEKN